MKKATKPFEQIVFDIKFCGIDGRTEKKAVVMLFMDVYTGIVFHDQYTTQTGKNVIVKYLRYIHNKYNFGNLNVNYTLITSLDETFKPIIELFLEDAKEIVFDAELSNKIGDTVRHKYVRME